ncbi:MAG: 50S ribosomal protein L31 [Chloroflexi bacterium]|nr:MAG: 50S ribosomal protein L31 [Chloroflexota bacterium]
MKQGIHPKYYPEATVVCSCGNTWTTGSTSESLRTDVCSQCHPFYTGEQRIVDTAGQVDRFMKRLSRYGSHQEDAKKRKAAALKKTEQRFLRQQLIALQLDDRVFQILSDNNIVTVGDLAKLVANDKATLMGFTGFGEKAYEEVETKLEAARSAFFAKA